MDIFPRDWRTGVGIRNRRWEGWAFFKFEEWCNQGWYFGTNWVTRLESISKWVLPARLWDVFVTILFIFGCDACAWYALCNWVSWLFSYICISTSCCRHPHSIIINLKNSVLTIIIITEEWMNIYTLLFVQACSSWLLYSQNIDRFILRLSLTHICQRTRYPSVHWTSGLKLLLNHIWLTGSCGFNRWVWDCWEVTYLWASKRWAGTSVFFYVEKNPLRISLF